MAWPLSQDYNEAIQDAAASFGDAELKQGKAAVNSLGIPMPRSGNFADVYEFTCPQRKWAVKCFTRQIPGLRERYKEVSAYLKQSPLPFMVEFTYLEHGIRVHGDWYPVLKMHWVEGFNLNQFVKDSLDRPQILDILCQLWPKLSAKLREAQIAHCDLQHGNVLLVPGSKAGSLAIKLVDYDGMCVPSLTMLKSIEVGHPNYQHPQRAREGIYSLEVDRFSHLVIYAAIRALMTGGKGLWQKYDNGDNLLFRAADFEKPNQSALFRELAQFPDPGVRQLADTLLQALARPLAAAPLLTQVASQLPAAPKSPTAVTRSLPAAPAATIPVGQPAVYKLASASATEELEASPRPRRKSAKKSSGLVWAAIAACVAFFLLVGGAAAVFLLRDKPTNPVVATNAPNDPKKNPPGNGEPQGKTPVDEPRKEPVVEPRKEPVKENTRPPENPDPDPNPNPNPNPPNRVEPADGKWENLLGRIDPARPGSRGWQRDGDALVSDRKQQAFLQIPFPQQSNYQLRLRAERLEGKDGFYVILRTGQSQCGASIDNFASRWTGLDLVDRIRVGDDKKTQVGSLLELNKECEILCTVRNQSIDVTLDGKPIIRWSGDFKRLSLGPPWNVEDRESLYLATWFSSLRITRLETMVIDPKEPDEAPKLPAEEFASLRFKPNAHVELANTAGLLDINGTFTAEMYVKLPAPNADQFLMGDLVSRPRGQPSGGWEVVAIPINLVGGVKKWGLRMHCQTAAGARHGAIGGVFTFSPDEWHHVALVKIEDRFILYVDGKGYGNMQYKPPLAQSPINLSLGGTRDVPRDAFTGEIRAFRASSKAIYQADFKPPARFTREADTVVLLDFPGKGTRLPDLAGKHAGRIVGGEWIGPAAAQPPDQGPLEGPQTEPGVESGVPLRFKPMAYVLLANSTRLIDWNKEVTVEMYLKLPPAVANTRGDAIIGQYRPGILDGGVRTWVVAVNQEAARWRLACGFDCEGGYVGFGTLGKFPMTGQAWHHLAIVHTPGDVDLFVDGKLFGNLKVDRRIQAGKVPICIGAGGIIKDGIVRDGPAGLHAELRGLRISSKARYAGPFDPPKKFDRDADTVALLDFSGRGTKLGDLAGNHHGRIVGAEWLAVADPLPKAKAPGAVDPKDWEAHGNIDGVWKTVPLDRLKPTVKGGVLELTGIDELAGMVTKRSFSGNYTITAEVKNATSVGLFRFEGDSWASAERLQGDDWKVVTLTRKDGKVSATVNGLAVGLTTLAKQDFPEAVFFVHVGGNTTAAIRNFKIRTSGETGADLSRLDRRQFPPVLRNALPPEIVGVIGAHTGFVQSCAFAPDGRLATAGADGTIRFWDLSGAAPKETAVLERPGKKMGVHHVVFSPDGKQMATVHGDNAGSVLQLWSMTSDGVQPTASSELGRIDDAAFHPDSKTIVFGSNAGYVCDTTAAGLKQPRAVLQGANSWFQFNADGSQFLSVFFQGARNGDQYGSEVKFWKIDQAKPVDGRMLQQDRSIKGLALSPDGKLLATGALDNTIRLWDLSGEGDPKLKTSFQMPSWAQHLHFTPDGQHLVAMTATNLGKRDLWLWNVATAKREKTWLIAGLPGGGSGGTSANALTVAPDGRHVVFSIGGSNVFIFRLPIPAK
jgi:WD40 repeat protein